MADSAGLTERLRATPEQIVDVLGAAELYPQWQGGVLSTEVLERDDTGRATLVTLHVDAKIKRISYTARYFYDLSAGRVGFDLVEGDLQEVTGRYRLRPRADGTTDVTMNITTEVGFYVPGPMKRMIRDQALKGSMRDLKRRVEG